jgi:hypothetical protein
MSLSHDKDVVLIRLDKIRKIVISVAFNQRFLEQLLPAATCQKGLFIGEF